MNGGGSVIIETIPNISGWNRDLISQNPHPFAMYCAKSSFRENFTSTYLFVPCTHYLKQDIAIAMIQYAGHKSDKGPINNKYVSTGLENGLARTGCNELS